MKWVNNIQVLLYTLLEELPSLMSDYFVKHLLMVPYFRLYQVETAFTSILASPYFLNRVLYLHSLLGISYFPYYSISFFQLYLFGSLNLK